MTDRWWIDASIVCLYFFCFRTYKGECYQLLSTKKDHRPSFDGKIFENHMKLESSVRNCAMMYNNALAPSFIWYGMLGVEAQNRMCRRFELSGGRLSLKRAILKICLLYLEWTRLVWEIYTAAKNYHWYLTY
jgi:hypothetical protein